jgi:hypothetical protein
VVFAEYEAVQNIVLESNKKSLGSHAVLLIRLLRGSQRTGGGEMRCGRVKVGNGVDTKEILASVR